MGLKIIGLDESGTIGDNYIVFCQVEFNIDDENELFINNILNIDNFLFSTELTNNLKAKKIVSLCHQLYDTGLIDVTFYKLSPYKQNSILKDAFEFQGNFLFANRGKLINIYDKYQMVKNDAEIECDVGIEHDLSNIIRELYHYRRPFQYPDYCLKSYSFLYILNQMCLNYNNCEFLKKSENRIYVQIDGGHLFSFWCHEFLFSHRNKEILQNKLFINGIAHGDESYLSINYADLFAKGYNLNSAKFYGYKELDIEYDFRKLPFAKEVFFKRIWRLLSKNVFKTRILLIGKSELFNIVTYLLHIEDRKKYHEPFKITGNITYFFKQNSRGYSRQNIVIYGDNLSDIDKENLKICRKMKIKTKSIMAFKKQIVNFFDSIETSTEEYIDSAKRKIKSLLDQKREMLS